MVNRRSLCKDCEESIDHILIHCNRTRVLCTFLLAIFGLKRELPSSVRNLFLEWKLKGLDRKSIIVWCITPLCLF